MRRFVHRTGYLWAVLVALSVAGCHSNNSTTPGVVAPTPINITEEFTGTLNINGGATFPFVAQSAGLITATLTALGSDTADTTTTIGLSLGTWNGTSCAVASIHNDSAGAGSSIIGQATSSGSLCTRVYDVGKISDSVPYTITVVHP